MATLVPFFFFFKHRGRYFSLEHALTFQKKVLGSCSTGPVLAVGARSLGCATDGHGQGSTGALHAHRVLLSEMLLEKGAWKRSAVLEAHFKLQRFYFSA